MVPGELRVDIRQWSLHREITTMWPYAAGDAVRSPQTGLVAQQHRDIAGEIVASGYNIPLANCHRMRTVTIFLKTVFYIELNGRNDGQSWMLMAEFQVIISCRTA